ncbi:MAG: hypothetical protein GC149_04135 [Gammaproteobacteria bacterium]|nr:hypothetical protein [Gammaproteobacteria bacterium]
MKQQILNQTGTSQGIKRHLFLALAFSSAIVLNACGGGASNTENPNPSVVNPPSTGSGTSTYTGPAPATADINAFKVNLWENLRSSQHCGNCHDGSAGHDSGGVFFANNADVNSAYNVVVNNSLVNLSRPDQSRLVTKFSTGSGHICLDGSNSVCAAELTNWITAWATANLGGGGRTIQFVAPNDTAPSPSIPLPSSTPSAYYTNGSATSIYSLVSTHCFGCHSEQHPQNDQAISPLFAVSVSATVHDNSNGDIDKSYQTAAAVPLINLSNPQLSRLYTRLAVDGHNCWTKCADDANDMLAAINMLKTQVVGMGGSNPLDNELTSRAVYLATDGIEASGGNRYEASQIALYEFKVGSGNTILDLSGVDPAMNLTLAGTEGVDYEWLSNWGIQFNTKNTKAQASTSTSSKLAKMIGLSGEYSIEAWVVPANINQDMANIVSYSGGPMTRNFTLGQDATKYEGYNYSSSTDPTGQPVLASPDNSLVATLQHVVLTYDPVNGRQIFVNGIAVAGAAAGSPDPTPVGTLTGWNQNLAFVLGNETSLDRPWLGTIRLLAIHDRALTATQVKQNYDVGVGQKYYLLFNISQHLGAECTASDGSPYCFIVMEASQFDNHSYLFNAPRFLDLNDASANFTNSILIKGMRVAINGVEAPSGQTYANLDVCVNGGCGDANEVDSTYVQGTGASLSGLGAVIAMQNGPKPAAGSGLTPDQIFLTFQKIGSAVPATPFAESSPTTPYLPAADVTTEPDVLMHTFEEINATLSVLTGIPRTNAAINNDSSLGDANDGTYTDVIQALPSSPGVKSFVSAQQMAITQLAITYCDQLVDSGSASTYFSGANLSGGMDLSSSTEQDKIINPLLQHVLNVDSGATDLTTMPDTTTVHGELASLMSSLYSSSSPACSGACSADRTKKIVKATCAAAMSSSPMLLN